MQGLWILSAFLCISLAQAGTFELADRVLRVIRKCSKHHQLKFQDVQAALRHGQLPTSPEGKCFVTCTLKEFELVKDNAFYPDGSYKLNELRFNNPKDLEKANEITKHCEEELAAGEYENECELGIAIANCGLKNSKSVGIISSELW